MPNDERECLWLRGRGGGGYGRQVEREGKKDAGESVAHCEGEITMQTCEE